MLTGANALLALLDYSTDTFTSRPLIHFVILYHCIMTYFL